MKRNASGYLSSMFLRNDYTRDSQSIANLFAGFFQSVYVQDDWIPDSDLPTPGDGHRMSANEVSGQVRFSGLWRQQRTRTVRNYSSYFETVDFGWRSFLTCHCLLVFFLPFGRSLLLFLFSRAAISVMCPAIAEYRSCRPIRNYSRKWYAIGLFQGFRQGASRFVEVQCVNFIWWVVLCWMGSYLTNRTQRVKLEDYLSESIQCHSGVSQRSHLGPIFFILDINGALDIFENVSVLGYADDLKLFMTSGIASCFKGI
jgi:hypothetical protein